MEKSSITLQILDNDIVGGFFRIDVLPDGNVDKWITTTFVSTATGNYYDCVVGASIEGTIDNLKIQIDNYYTGAGATVSAYIVTKIGTDTLNIEIIYDYLKLSPGAFNGFETKSLITTDNVLNIKYFLEYNDVVNVLHRFEIYDPNYYDAPIEITGYISMDYGQINENLEAIRGQGLRVNLDANVDLSFDDLFNEQQKTLSTTYYRNSIVLFRGWLNSEGFYEDYVNDKWVVSFDCIDGIGYLSDLAFVDSSGLNIVGIKSQLEILSIALKRTGIEQNILVSIDVFYTGLSDTESILENVKVNSKRYIN